MLPLVLLVTLAVLRTAGVARDLLLVHEVARAGVRAAATSRTAGPAVAAATQAAQGHDVEVTVTPAQRGPGQLVRVEAVLSDRFGPLPYRVRAEAVARVEPGA